MPVTDCCLPLHDFYPKPGHYKRVTATV